MTPHWHGRPLHAVLFDLDGTLADTAADIALALRLAMAEQGLAAPPVAAVRTMIGRGAAVLVARAVDACGTPVDAAAQGALLAGYHRHYAALHDELLGGGSKARAYAGVAEGLAALHAAGLRLVVVTNKPQAIALRLLQRLGLSPWFDLVVGGDNVAAGRKPAADPLLHACDAMGVAPSQALMVGDSGVDVAAARAAGLPVLCVPYGYNEGEDVRALACDGFVDSLAALPGRLMQRSTPSPTTTPARTRPAAPAAARARGTAPHDDPGALRPWH